MTPVQRYYVQNVMPRVNQMLLGVIGIGVLTLSVKYVYLITEQPGIVLNENFWKRIVLLGLTSSPACKLQGADATRVFQPVPYAKEQRNFLPQQGILRR